MKDKINITATYARELASVKNQLPKIKQIILDAATTGEVGVYINGQLSYPLIKNLRDDLEFEVTYDSASKRTWIWWGED
jgi:hypothetical protein